MILRNATLLAVLSPNNVAPMKSGWLVGRRTVTKTTVRTPSLLAIGFVRTTVGLVANVHRVALLAMVLFACPRVNVLRNPMINMDTVVKLDKPVVIFWAFPASFYLVPKSLNDIG
jgi:hypothetical protein